jgi:hypothetical protein
MNEFASIIAGFPIKGKAVFIYGYVNAHLIAWTNDKVDFKVGSCTINFGQSLSSVIRSRSVLTLYVVTA